MSVQDPIANNSSNAGWAGMCVNYINHERAPNMDEVLQGLSECSLLDKHVC